MNFKYLRVAIFSRLLSPYSGKKRQARMDWMRRVMGVRAGSSVLDLGGQPMIWDSFPDALNITILNLPGIAVENHTSHHAIEFVEGDACAVRGTADRPFDLVFSNSVIEHVGDSAKRAAFASEVRRLGRSYWVQTPAIWFPIEAHCGMPFWWFYPQSLRTWLLKRWQAKLPAWTEMVAGTTVVSRGELERLFPDATITREWSLGFVKSYIAHYQDSAGRQRPT